MTEDLYKKGLAFLRTGFQGRDDALSRRSLLKMAFSDGDPLLGKIQYTHDHVTFCTGLLDAMLHHSSSQPDTLCRFLTDAMVPLFDANTAARIADFVRACRSYTRPTHTLTRLHRFDLENQEMTCEEILGCPDAVLALAIPCRFDEFHEHFQRRLEVLMGMGTQSRTIINLEPLLDDFAMDGLSDAIEESKSHPVIQPFRLDFADSAEVNPADVILQAAKDRATGTAHKLLLLFYVKKSVFMPNDATALAPPAFPDTVFYPWAKGMILQDMGWTLATAQLWRSHYKQYCIREGEQNLRRVYEHLRTFTKLIDEPCDETRFIAELEQFKKRKNDYQSV